MLSVTSRLASAFLLAAPGLAASGAPARFKDMSDAEIAVELKAVHAANPELAPRIAAVSERFLGIPYKLGPLGEGETGEFDTHPLVSFQALDCTTFVEETMALSLEPNLARVKELLQRIRYKDGHVAYASRNHFPETDWIPNNIRAGFLTDITRQVAGRRMRWAFKNISKEDWYAQKSSADLSAVPNEAPAAARARLERWRALGEGMGDENARLPYLPIEDLPGVAARIPSGAIANVIRESKDDKPVIVTHQVLILQTPGGPVIRHAAPGREVMDAPLVSYFEGLKDAKWRIVGLNLNALRPRP